MYTATAVVDCSCTEAVLFMTVEMEVVTLHGKKNIQTAPVVIHNYSHGLCSCLFHMGHHHTVIHNNLLLYSYRESLSNESFKFSLSGRKLSHRSAIQEEFYETHLSVKERRKRGRKEG